MNFKEKIVVIISIVFLSGLLLTIVIFPQTRTIGILIPFTLTGVMVNAALLFIVFRDMLTRSFPSKANKYFWVALVFLCFPTILIYLPLHGFKDKNRFGSESPRM